MRSLPAVLVLVACTSPSRLDGLQAPSRSSTPRSAARVAPLPPIRASTFHSSPPQEPIVGIGRGESTACVVRASGHVDCWGRSRGVPDAEVRRVPGISDARAIDETASCVLRATGDVACFAEPLVLQPQAGSNVEAFGTGTRGCYVHRDRTASCDGRTLPAVTDATAISRNHELVCIVRTSGTVACTKLRELSIDPWRSVDALGRVKQLQLANTHWERAGCALLETGHVRCFLVELDERGVRIVDTDGEGRSLKSFDQAQLAGASRITVAHHSWQGNIRSQLELEAIVGGKVVHWGAEERTTRTLPSLVDATHLVSSCVLRATGAVACWGANEGGVLGPTTIGRTRLALRAVAELSEVVAIALGERDSWALDDEGRLFTWGEHGDGRPTAIELPRGMARITAISASVLGVCVRAGDEVWCQRRGEEMVRVHQGPLRSFAMTAYHGLVVGEDGRVVDVPARDTHEVGEIAAPPDTVSLVPGYDVCALLSSGEVHCIQHDEWHGMSGITGISQAWTTVLLGCGIRAGAVSCWRPALDRGSSTAPAPAFIDALQVTVTDDRACALRAGGRVSCWLEDDVSKVTDVLSGGATYVALGHAENPPSEPRVVALSHGCAIMADRTVACWGSNVHGQLGDGSLRWSDAPVGMDGL